MIAKMTRLSPAGSSGRGILSRDGLKNSKSSIESNCVWYDNTHTLCNSQIYTFSVLKRPTATATSASSQHNNGFFAFGMFITQWHNIKAFVWEGMSRFYIWTTLKWCHWSTHLLTAHNASFRNTFNACMYGWRVYTYRRSFEMDGSQISENFCVTTYPPLPSSLLSVLVPWQRWMRLWCGRRSCPRWTPHRCPSSPHPPPRTARPCPPSGDVANCWAAARGAAAVTAGPPARLLPPLPLPLHPAEGRWRAAARAGWTGSIPGRLKGKIAAVINKLRVLLNSAHCKLHTALIPSVQQ